MKSFLYLCLLVTSLSVSAEEFLESPSLPLPQGVTIDGEGFSSPIQSPVGANFGTYDQLVGQYSGSSSISDDMLSRFAATESGQEATNSGFGGGGGGPSYANQDANGAARAPFLTYDFFSDIRKHRSEYSRESSGAYNPNGSLAIQMEFPQFRPPAYGTYQNLRDLTLEKFNRH